MPLLTLIWQFLVAVTTVLGLVSIGENLVKWHDFFVHATAIYRDVRDFVLTPLFSWLQVSPPWWLPDLIVVWAVFSLAINIDSLHRERKAFVVDSVQGWIRMTRRDGIPGFILGLFFVITINLVPPAMILLALLFGKHQDAWEIGQFVLGVLAVFCLALLVNWYLTSNL